MAKKGQGNRTLTDFLQKNVLEEKKKERKKQNNATDEQSTRDASKQNIEVKVEPHEYSTKKKTNWFVRADNIYIKNGYLLSYYYDPNKNVALLLFYDDDEKRVKYWYDKTGHKPYFIVKEKPDEVQRIIPANLKTRVKDVTQVVKFNLLKMKKEMYTKVIVDDPLAVRELRSKFKETWESNIKYHQNYIYDNNLIPGVKYEVTGKKLRLRNDETVNDFQPEKIIEAASTSSLSLAKELITLLEQEPPSPKMAAIDIEVYSPIASRLPDPEKASFPIISIAIATSDGISKVFMLYTPNLGKISEIASKSYEIQLYDNEYSLLLDFFSLISEYPVVLSFNGDNFDLPYLRKRAKKLGFREEEIPIIQEQGFYTFKTGIHIDMYSVFDNKALKTYVFGGTYRENTLDAVAEAVLGVGKIEITKEISKLSFMELAEYNYRDAYLTLNLMQWKNNLTWKLLVVLSRLSKTGIEELSRNQISIWIRNMMYWEHRKRGYLIPNKEDLIERKGELKSKAIIKGKKYAGAIVLDPPVGVFFNVQVLDFASLYPTIIKVWNLSYETVNPQYPCKRSREVPEVGHTVCFDKDGLTSQYIGVLRDLRVKLYKKKSKDSSVSEEKRLWYNAVQSSLKVFLNASYGVFGSENFALYTPPVAESVTAIGRFVIKSTMKKAEEMGLKILYGDTDSMFLWSPKKESISRLIREIEEENRLDLEIDKIFRYVAFSGLKKNYLGVTPAGEVEIKGLLGKKRNQPEFLKSAFKEMISIIASVEKPSEFEDKKKMIVGKIKDIYKQLKNKGYTLDELAFNVMLNKSIKEYDKTTPQHVKAAMMLEYFGKTFARGDIISFVKVKNKEGVKPVQLAKLSEIDIEKYLEALKSTFEQILMALNVEWKEIEGVARLETFFT